MPKISDASSQTHDAIKAAIGMDPVTDTLDAMIIPRYDTLANLLAISDAGDGEIAVATDADAIVLYKGSPSVGRPYFSTGFIEKVFVSMAFTAVPSGAGVTPFPISASYDPNSRVDGVANIITPPPLNIAGDTYFVKFVTSFSSIPGIAVGTNVTVTLERQRISDDAWTSFLFLTGIHNNAAGAQVMTGVDEGQYNPTLYKALRIKFSHDDTGSTFIAGTFNLTFSQLP